MGTQVSKEFQRHQNIKGCQQYWNIYTNTLIFWLDNNQSQLQLRQLSKVFKIQKIRRVEKLIEYLDKFSFFHPIKIICSGGLANDLCDELKKKSQNENFPKNKQIFVYCGKPSQHKHLLQNKMIQCVQDMTKNLISYIKVSLISTETPQFRTFFYKIDQKQRQKNSYFFQNLIKPKKDKKQNDFVDLIKRYPQYNRAKQNILSPIEYRSTLDLYLSPPFFFQINYHLKNCNYKYLHFAKGIISDLYHQIKDKSSFDKRSEIKQSIFYSEIILNKHEKEIFLNLTNENVECLGFLFASYRLPQKNNFLHDNTLLTIYIPQLFRSKQFSGFALKRGFVDLRKQKIQSYNRYQLIFNLKTFLKIINSSQKQNSIEAIYGLDEYIYQIQNKYQQNQNRPFFQLYNMSRLQWDQKVKNCPCGSIAHIVGTVSKIIKCLDKLKKEDLVKQSYFVMNKSRVVSGMVIYYSQQIQRDIQNKRENKRHNLVCKDQNCQYDLIVKCSKCPQQIFCYCQLEHHDQQHLHGKAVIMIESYVPRFMEKSFYSRQYNQMIKQRQYEEEITNFYNQLEEIKHPNNHQAIRQKYNILIKNQLFYKLDGYTRFSFLFKRATLWRVYNINPQTQDQQNLNSCKKIAQNQLQDKGLIAKAIYNIALISYQKMHLNNFIYNYSRGLLILDKMKDLTDEEQINKVEFLHLFGKYYLNNQKYQNAKEVYIRSLEQITKLQKYQKALELKLINRLVISLNNLNKFKESIVYCKKAYEISLNIKDIDQTEKQLSKMNYQMVKTVINQSQN